MVRERQKRHQLLARLRCTYLAVGVVVPTTESAAKRLVSRRFLLWNTVFFVVLVSTNTFERMGKFVTVPALTHHTVLKKQTAIESSYDSPDPAVVRLK